MKNVLIIEDDPTTAHIYKTRLEKADFEVQVCSDGQSGFFQLHQRRPDAVLLDMMLPKMNGLELLKKIRAQPRFEGTPVLVFTNAYVPNMVHEATKAGATYVFNKASLTPRQLLEALSTIGAGGAPKPAPPAPDKQETKADQGAPHAGLVGEPPFHDQRDAEMESDLLRQFLDTAPGKLAELRQSHRAFSKARDQSARRPLLMEMYAQVHGFTSIAGLAGFYDLAQMAAALEVLLKELHDQPKNITDSTLRTVTHGIDFLGHLLRHDTQSDLLTGPTNILVVDDELLSRRAVTFALEKANLQAVSVEDPKTALKMAQETSYDLIFLDVKMPEMDGYELCKRIRAVAANRSTPVLFVTSLTDFHSRARSSLSGGTDFIAKPFLFIEVSVKALIHVLQRRLAKN